MKHRFFFPLLFDLFLLGNTIISLGLFSVVYQENNVCLLEALLFSKDLHKGSSNIKSRGRKICEFDDVENTYQNIHQLCFLLKCIPLLVQITKS